MDMPGLYQDYIACLNSRKLDKLHLFVDAAVIYNHKEIGLPGYIKMLEQNYREIPDLTFTVSLLISEKQYVASHLSFDCTPTASFLSLPVNGRRIQFTENVFYKFQDKRIVEVWSVIDKAAIEAQLNDDA